MRGRKPKQLKKTKHKVLTLEHEIAFLEKLDDADAFMTLLHEEEKTSLAQQNSGSLNSQ